MKLRRASVRIDSGLDRVDGAVQMLEDEWRRHGDVHLESFWAERNRMGAVGADGSVVVLIELIKADLRRRFDAGAEAYGRRIPGSVSRAGLCGRSGVESGVRGVLPV